MEIGTPGVFVQLLLDCCELPLSSEAEAPAPPGSAKPQKAYIYCVVSVGSESKPSWVIAENSKAVFSQAFEFMLQENSSFPFATHVRNLWTVACGRCTCLDPL